MKAFPTHIKSLDFNLFEFGIYLSFDFCYLEFERKL